VGVGIYRVEHGRRVQHTDVALRDQRQFRLKLLDRHALLLQNLKKPELPAGLYLGEQRLRHPGLLTRLPEDIDSARAEPSPHILMMPTPGALW
jgi:hypothetical protein